MELRIPSAETYGVANLAATALLDDFCTDPRSRANCTQTGARNQLSMVVGSAVFEKHIETKNAGKYRLGAEILLISRVYLTRSIETVSWANSALSAHAKLTAGVKEAQQSLEARAPSPKDASAPPAAGEMAALRRTLEDQKERLNALISEASGASTSSSVSAESADLSRIGVTQSIQRPVAFGFRAARRKLVE